MTDALAPRALFFLRAPALIPWEQAFRGHGWTWWIGVILGAWTVVLILFVVWWALWGARWIFGPRDDDDRS